MPPVARLIKEMREGAVGRIWMVAIREHRFPFLVKVRPLERKPLANLGSCLRLLYVSEYKVVHHHRDIKLVEVVQKVNVLGCVPHCK